MPPPLGVSGNLPPLTLYAGGNEMRVDAGVAIKGQNLQWRFDSSDPGVTSVRGDGSEVLVTPGYEGTAEITATATNATGSASVAFTVSVRTSAAEVAAIKTALSAQGRVLLGSVSEVIGERVSGGSGDAVSRMASGCGGSADGSDGSGLHPRGTTWHVDHDRDPGSYAGGFGGDFSQRSHAGGVEPGDISRVGDADEGGRFGGRGRGMTGDFDDAVSLMWGRSFSLALDGEAPDCAGRGWSLWSAADLQRATVGNDVDGEWRFLYLGIDRAFGEG